MNLTTTRSFGPRSRKRILKAMGKKIFWKLVVTRNSCKEKNGKMRKYALTNIFIRLIKYAKVGKTQFGSRHTVNFVGIYMMAMMLGCYTEASTMAFFSTLFF